MLSLPFDVYCETTTTVNGSRCMCGFVSAKMLHTREKRRDGRSMWMRFNHVKSGVWYDYLCRVERQRVK